MPFEDYELERRIAAKEATRENSARLAAAYGAYESTGQGSIVFERRTNFGLTFIEKPFVSYGSIIDLDALGELLDIPDTDDVPIPLVTGVVIEWDLNDLGHYVGAWVGARVHFPSDLLVPVDPEVKVVVEHHFTFQAIAIKDVPIDLTD